MAYKIIKNDEEGDYDIFKDNVYIPMDVQNIDYIQFLDDLSEELDTVEGPDIQELSYVELRRKSYPSLEDQNDMMYWDSVNGTTTFKDAIQAVKDAHPTTITGGTTVGDIPSVITDAIEDHKIQKQRTKYAKAVERLSQYRLADGLEELTEEVVIDTLFVLGDNGHPLIGEDGEQVIEEVNETVIIQSAIPALPSTISVKVSDPETREVTTENVANPLVVEDDLARADAQAVIDATPEEIITAYNEENPQ